MTLLAWIVADYPDRTIVARFVAVAEFGTRAPATRRFDNRDDARAWIDAEAAAINARVRWIDACR